MMLRAAAAIAILALTSVAAPVARADSGPVFAVPGRAGHPVPINGCNAAYRVVEGDWGLFRPGHRAPTVIECAPLPRHRYAVRRTGNFPRYGAPPPRGRNETDPGPDRPLPEPAESFHRSWSSNSDVRPHADVRHDEPRQTRQPYRDGEVPATLDNPQSFVPPIVIAPDIRRRRP